MSTDIKLLIASGIAFVLLLLKTLLGVEIAEGAVDAIVEAIVVVVGIVLGLLGKDIQRHNEVNAVTADFQARIRQLTQK